VIIRRRFTSTTFCKLGIQPEEPKLRSAIGQRVTPPTNHVNNVIGLIQLPPPKSHTQYKSTLNTNIKKILKKNI